MNRIILFSSIFVLAGLACNFSPAGLPSETEEPALTEDPGLEAAITEELALTEEPVVTEEPLAPTETATALPQPTLPPSTAAPTATSPPPTATEIEVEWPLIKEGHCGSVVKAAQYLLRSQGYIPIMVDSVFGPQTKTRTKAFQSDEGLVSDGIIGPITWRELIKGQTVSQGTGPEVRAVQTMLRAQGYDEVDLDGIFGPITRGAVIDFQTENDLLVDGIVGPQTWKWLISLPFEELVAC